MLSKRERIAQRADKWWRSIYLTQMLMRQDGNDRVPKPLTTRWVGRMVKPQSTAKGTKHDTGCQIPEQESSERVCA
jgi:hypothetical protein